MILKRWSCRDPLQLSLRELLAQPAAGFGGVALAANELLFPE